jgi:hypothetical protein
MTLCTQVCSCNVWISGGSSGSRRSLAEKKKKSPLAKMKSMCASFAVVCAPVSCHAFDLACGFLVAAEACHESRAH